MTIYSLTSVGVLAVLLLVAPLRAETPVFVQSLAVIYATPGEIHYQLGGQSRILQSGDRIKPEGSLSSGTGRAVLRAFDGSEIKLLENTQLELSKLHFDEKKNQLLGELQVKLGSLFLQVQHPRGRDNRLKVKVGDSVAGVRGTNFLAEIDQALNARYSTHAGRIQVSGRETLEAAGGEGIYAPATGKFSKVKLPPSPRHGTPSGQVYAPFSFEWEPIAGINRYQVTVAKDAAMNEVVFVGQVEAPTKVAFDMFTPGKYYWHVQAIDDLGFASVPAKPVEFVLVR